MKKLCICLNRDLPSKKQMIGILDLISQKIDPQCTYIMHYFNFVKYFVAQKWWCKPKLKPNTKDRSYFIMHNAIIIRNEAVGKRPTLFWAQMAF